MPKPGIGYRRGCSGSDVETITCNETDNDVNITGM